MTSSGHMGTDEQIIRFGEHDCKNCFKWHTNDGALNNGGEKSPIMCQTKQQVQKRKIYNNIHEYFKCQHMRDKRKGSQITRSTVGKFEDPVPSKV